MPLEQVVLASGNAGKLREFSHLLEPLHIRARSQAEFGVQPVEETGRTFIENALLKARAASAASGRPALGDDSGLVVDALDGAPGIYSSRFAGPEATDADNNRRLLERLEGLPMDRRGAHFHCCLVLLKTPDDPAPLIATGSWHGRILEQPRGDQGFGYDPLFLDPKLGVSAAELGMAEKSRISHRGKALSALIEQIKKGG